MNAVILKKIFIVSALAILVLFPATVALADEYGLDSTAVSAGLKTTGGTDQPKDVKELAGIVIGTALSMIGVVFFVLMIYAGLRWMTARGNSELTQKAMDTMTAAVIGLIVVLASYALTQFVFKAVNDTGATATPATLVTA